MFASSFAAASSATSSAAERGLEFVVFTEKVFAEGKEVGTVGGSGFFVEVFIDGLRLREPRVFVGRRGHFLFWVELLLRNSLHERAMQSASPVSKSATS